jgi:hypothetical protein
VPPKEILNDRLVMLEFALGERSIWWGLLQRMVRKKRLENMIIQAVPIYGCPFAAVIVFTRKMKVDSAVEARHALPPQRIFSGSLD